MMSFLGRLFGTAPAPVLEPGPEPRFDDAVARRLEAAGKSPERVEATAAEALEIPPKLELPGFNGMIRFELTLNEQGKVAAVTMDHAPFDHVEELETWARRWSFTPARLEGKAHPCRMVYEVHWS